MHLSEIGATELLRVAGDVHIPTSVDVELQRCLPDWPEAKPAWLHVTTPESVHMVRADEWMRAGVIHAGEAAALALACQLHADWFLTDDAAARLLACTLGLEVHGTLGVLLWAAATRQTEQGRARYLLGQLARSSLWLSPRVLAEARAALEAMG